MNLTHRPYQRSIDLLSIGQLIRGAYAIAPNWNTYSFARFDIWAQRRLSDEALLNDRAWQRDFRLWETADGLLAGAVFFESDRDAVLIGHPDWPDLIEPMLAYAEARYVEKGSPEPLMIEAMESNVARCELLTARGYALFQGHFIHRHKVLDPQVIEPVSLPSGYSFKLLARGDLPQYLRAVFAVFGRSGTVESDPFLANAPSYVPELDLMVLSDQHEIAAFCTVWVDPVNHYAEFEPVGTVPSFQKRGLGSALLAEACNRLRQLGCPLVTVQSWSTAEGANKLYQGAGLLPKDNQLNWCWRKP
ncbi:MAG: GNAT family N-acetyltransferase [Thermoflexales bacterium]|nr:GNAT family N-acetyltransferase [Thermoflexales bacterium]